jgi:2-dehydro-3-deoxygluconokinase
MLNNKPGSDSKWDIVSLGEVMLRFDPGEDRIHTARVFRVWEGGGEYNVARNLSKCFRRRAAIVTALADNQIGRLVEDLILQGGVDASQILWRKTDGISREVRNGMYFMERGFASRPPTGCSDRGNTAISKLDLGEIDWTTIFAQGTRWLHTGGIFAGLSKSTAEVAAESMQAAKESGAIVSYDLNYRESLWSGRGGREAANELNNELLTFADVVFGVEGFETSVTGFSERSMRDAASLMISRHPNIKILATTLRDVRSASQHNFSGACFSGGEVFKSKDHMDVHVLDRVGSGDAFAAGLIHGLLSAESLQTSIDLASASGVLALSSAGDGSSATLREIETLAQGTKSTTVR